MTTIARHNELVARLLGYLASNGYGRTELNNDVVDVIIPSGEQSGGDHAIVAGILQWMSDEGLIRVGKRYEMLDDSFVLTGVQLTSKATAILQRDINIDGEIKNLDVKLAEPNLEASSYGKIGAFVGGILGGFTKSIG